MIQARPTAGALARLNVNNGSKLRSLALGLGCLASIALAPSCSGAQTSAPIAEGPIAFTGHGALFDRAGNELALTPEFIEQAQAFYLNLLLGLADDEQRQSFRELEAQLGQGLTLDRQSRLVVNARLIERLIHSVGPEDADRLLSINNQMTFELERRLPATPGARGIGAPFELPGTLQQRLQQARLAPTPGTAALVADAGGAAYRQLCAANGVPVPPEWGTDAWAFRGILDKEFISGSLQAEVFAFKSPTPEGACLALPRFNQDDDILFLGVICLGKASGKACFWDNYKNGNKVIWQRGQDVPLSEFGGGTELLGGDVCSDTAMPARTRSSFIPTPRWARPTSMTCRCPPTGTSRWLRPAGRKIPARSTRPEPAPDATRPAARAAASRRSRTSCPATAASSIPRSRRRCRPKRPAA